MPVLPHPGSQESSWLKVWELLVFYLGAFSFLLYKLEIIMPQFFSEIFLILMGLVYRQVILQAVISGGSVHKLQVSI